MAVSRSNLDTLKLVLCAAVNGYLLEDNPKPDANAGFFAKAWATAYGFYNHQGKDGRDRAHTYKESIRQSTESYDALFLRVIGDIQREDSCLSTSTKLRIRLLKGLCTCSGFNDGAIKSAVDKTRLSRTDGLAVASAHAYALVPSESEIQISAMLELLQGHIKQATQVLDREKQKDTAISNGML